MLKAFVNKCRELYQIAFFQWRDQHPTPIRTNMNEIVELIEMRIEWTYKRNININGENCPMDVTIEGS